MPLAVILSCECLAALRAGVWPLRHMGTNVVPHMKATREALLTHGALPRCFRLRGFWGREGDTLVLESRVEQAFMFLELLISTKAELSD